MSKRNLFVSFAESDGGHSYLAARAMLEPASVAHLIFRNTVADSLDAVAAGQANYAVVPSYNSITQWDGATLKALATGQFEIYAQVCMPTSYVLVAHKDYMTEFVNAYLTLRDPTANPTPEEAAKIYTRFLTRIYVGAQAEEQYRGRLIRPDMKDATIELSRNPLRILEEITRSELIKAMAASAPGARQGIGGYQPGLPPNVSGGSINIGAAPVLSQAPVMAPMPVLDTLQAPAALVAAGLLDAPGDPEGWDQPGSLGEIVALLRKLLVLLNVYSFGSPDLPENKTQFLLVGRRGQATAPEAVRSPVAAATRISALVRPTLKKSSADQWLAPRKALARRARDYGFVFDRPPMLLSPGNQRVFLFEGGKPKDGVLPNPIGALERGADWLSDVFSPPAKDGDKPRARAREKDKSLRKSIEKKADGKVKDDTPEKFDVTFLGQYPTWCVDLAPGSSCWCCEEAHAEKQDEGGVGIPFVQFLVASLVALTALALIILPIYCTFTGACTWFGGTPTFEIPKVQPQPATPPPTAAPVEQAAPPQPAAPAAPAPATYPGVNGNGATAPAVTPKVEAPKPPPVFHVAFFEAKSNLTREALNALAAAAAQVLQTERTTKVRVVALGARETDSDLWRRRLYAVKDELVRLGVPADRIRYEGTGPYVVTIRPNRPQRESSLRRRFRSDLDMVPDPLSGSYQ